MIYEKSINSIGKILDKYFIGHIERGVTWTVVNGETSESKYVVESDTVYIHPQDIRWSWAFGSTTYAAMFHELGHRFAEKILTKSRLKKKEITELFGYYYSRYWRNLRYASMATKKNMFDFPSRYSLTHPMEDFSEIFSVCLQYIVKDKNPETFTNDYMKSELCRKKITKMMQLIEESKPVIDKNS